MKWLRTSLCALAFSPSQTRRTTSHNSRLRAGTVLVLAAGLLAVGLLSQGSSTAVAAAAPVTQCNNDTASNVGGQGIACTVNIVNYVTSTGSIDVSSPSRVTVTRCVGAAGPIAAGAGTCSTTTSTSAEPVTLVQQCNGSGNGGGGVVKCSVTITNYFSGAPAGALSPATVYQCIGSVITGTGGPGSCTPANTPGVTSVSAATVGQCNGSGNGGTSVGFICTVTTGSTMTSSLAVNVDQCNGSGNGGGALVNCSSTVSNQVVPSTATPSATATSATPTATATSATTATSTPSSTPGTVTATPSASASPTGTPTAVTRTPVPATVTTTPTMAPGATGTASPPATGTPRVPGPPATGNGQSGAPGVSWQLVILLLSVTSGTMLAGRRLFQRYHSR